MILIKNTQRTIAINKKALQHDAAIILKALNYADYELGIWITTNTTIRTYNKTYRNKDKATDILSFSNYPDLKPGERITPRSEEEKNLGDLIISAEYVKAAAQELGVSFEDRMKVLLVHGICHLLGYDHEKDEDYKVMHKKETALLKLL